MEHNAKLSANDMIQMVRGKDPMHGLCEARQITPEACDWVKSSLDPFHDFTLEHLRGYPDVSTDATVIVKVNQSVEVSAPPGLAAGQNWDCHIVTSPIDWAKPNSLLTLSTTTGYNTAVHSNPYGNGSTWGAAGVDFTDTCTARIDGLIINSVPSSGPPGASMTYTPGHMPHVAAGGYETQNLVLDQYFELDPEDYCVYRIVYSGFEVVNTTAMIHMQGAVTCYEYGNEYQTSQIHRFTANPDPDVSALRNESVNVFRCPPNNLEEAKIMPSAHSWAAKDGVYCVAKFQQDNPFQGLTQRNYILQQNVPTGSSNSGFIASGAPGFSAGSIASPGLGSYLGFMSVPVSTSIPATHFSRMNTAGAYFTGLSPQSTLLVTWRVGIERLPSANSPLMLSLAQPSAAFDPNALVLYNLIAAKLPPGVPQGYNDIGKWFSMISNVARTVIPAAYPMVGMAQTILNSLGRPAAASALGAAAAATKQVQARSAPSTPRQQQTPRSQRSVQNYGAPGKGNAGKKRK